MIKVLANAVVVIILQYINLSNQHVIYFKLIRCYMSIISQFKTFLKIEGFLGGTVVESLPANAGDMGSSPGLGRSHMPWSN